MKKVNEYATEWHKLARQGRIILNLEGDTQETEIVFDNQLDFLLFLSILREKDVYYDGIVIQSS